MPASVTRTLGPSQSTQRLIWTYGNGTTIRAYCWGGGGGGGGNDSGTGGSGAGGGFGYTEFSVNNGDVIDIAVGGAGSAGASGATGSGGGSPGGGYLLQEIFNSRTSIPSGWSTPSNPSYSQFLNTYGIWPNNYSIAFDYTWTITVSGGEYMFQAGFDCPRINQFQFDINTPRVTVSIDGTDRFFVVPVVNYFNFAGGVNANSAINPTMNYNVTLSAGTHTIRVRSNSVNSLSQTGPGSFGLRIGSASGSFSGARGGNAGYSGYSGAGGGGGGATTVYLNGTLVACGGGGGGGGGAGNNSTGASAPGAAGQVAPGVSNAGQNGYNKNGDGGGGGGGGGGAGGGQGGGCPGGDIGGLAGSNGGNYGLATASSTGVSPAGSNYAYYNSNVARGGAPAANGNGGVCVMEFFLSGINVKTAGGWQPVQASWIKVNNTWKKIQAGWTKTAGTWQYFVNSFAPNFSADPLTYSVNSRVAPENQGDVPPDTPSPDWGVGPDWGGDGGGGGGGKVICTELYHQGFLDQTVYELDQEFGRWLAQNRPTTYWGYRAWADILVRYMRGQGRPLIAGLAFWLNSEQKQQLSKRIALSIAKMIGKPFAHELARRSDPATPRPLRIGGWLVVSLGLPICWIIGRVMALKKKQLTRAQ